MHILKSKYYENNTYYYIFKSNNNNNNNDSDNETDSDNENDNFGQQPWVSWDPPLDQTTDECSAIFWLYKLFQLLDKIV